MTLTGKEKAALAFIVTFVLGLVGQIATQLQQGQWNAQSYWTLGVWIASTLGATLGVYFKANTPPTPPPDPALVDKPAGS
jgi:hypothetical protein